MVFESTIITYGMPYPVLPACYCRESDCGVDYRLDTAAQVAKMIAVQRELGLRGGQVVAVSWAKTSRQPRKRWACRR